MKEGLKKKEAQLNEKNILAEQKMGEMVQGQTQAEAQKKEAARIGEALKLKQVKITERKSQVEGELSDVEPTLARAKEAVGSISKKALDELKNLAWGKPPESIKLVLEAAMSMLTNKASAIPWEEVRKVTKDPNFIANVQSFDPDTMSNGCMEKIKNIIQGSNWEIAKIKRASLA